MTEERSRRGRPQWAALVVGVLAIVLGAALITRPFSSLAVLTILIAAGFVVHGAGDLAAGDVAARGPTADRRVAQAIGLVWIVAGVGVLVWPGLTLRALSVFVGVALIVAGGTRIVSGVRADTDARWAAVLLGAAGIVLGIVSLGWPDMTILVVGVVFGIWLLAFGIGRLIEAIRGPESDGRHAERGQPRHRGWARTAGSAVALVMALAVGGLSVRLHAAEPVPDAFYDTPSTVPGEPGSLLRSESFNREVPTGAVAWRILYTTTRSDGSPAVASGLVVVPTAPNHETAPGHRLGPRDDRGRSKLCPVVAPRALRVRGAVHAGRGGGGGLGAGRHRITSDWARRPRTGTSWAPRPARRCLMRSGPRTSSRAWT